MTDRRLLLRGLLSGAALLTLAPAYAVAQQASPEQAVSVIRTFCNALLETMKEAARLGARGRYQQFDPAVQRAYNLPLMARLAVGPDWQKLSPDDQQKLAAAFSEYSIATYAARFDGYAGERFEVDPDPTPSGNDLIVKTKLIRGNGEPVQLNYLMRRGDAGWQVIDVFLSGTISQLATQRSEFSAVMRRDGGAALLRLLQQRVADMMK